MFQGVKFQANWAEIWILRKYSVSEICHYLVDSDYWYYMFEEVKFQVNWEEI